MLKLSYNQPTISITGDIEPLNIDSDEKGRQNRPSSNSLAPLVEHSVAWERYSNGLEHLLLQVCGGDLHLPQYLSTLPNGLRPWLGLSNQDAVRGSAGGEASSPARLRYDRRMLVTHCSTAR